MRDLGMKTVGQQDRMRGGGCSALSIGVEGGAGSRSWMKRRGASGLLPDAGDGSEDME